jgi:hypothetical protein
MLVLPRGLLLVELLVLVQPHRQMRMCWALVLVLRLQRRTLVLRRLLGLQVLARQMSLPALLALLVLALLRRTSLPALQERVQERVPLQS